MGHLFYLGLDRDHLGLYYSPKTLFLGSVFLGFKAHKAANSLPANQVLTMVCDNVTRIEEIKFDNSQSLDLNNVFNYSGFFPVAINFLRRIPVIGTLLNLPGISMVINTKHFQ